MLSYHSKQYALVSAASDSGTPRTVARQAPLSMGILQAKMLERESFFSPGGSSQPRDRIQVSHIADSLPSEPPGKPKNTGVGSVSLLQGIIPTQKSNRGLLYFRQILSQLSYQGRRADSHWPLK